MKQYMRVLIHGSERKDLGHNQEEQTEGSQDNSTTMATKGKTTEEVILEILDSPYPSRWSLKIIIKHLRDRIECLEKRIGESELGCEGGCCFGDTPVQSKLVYNSQSGSREYRKDWLCKGCGKVKTTIGD